jgi:hypothetical protein
MTSPAEMNERHGRILGRLAELGLSLAEQVHADAMAAEDTEVRASLATVFHRISRSLRQTLALEARLERDARRAEREDRSDERGEAQARVAAHRAQVGATVERLIWNEHEGEEAERLIREAEACLDEEALYDDFLDDTVEARIQRFAREFGLSAPVASPATPGIPLTFDSSPDGGATEDPDARDRPSSG